MYNNYLCILYTSTYTPIHLYTYTPIHLYTYTPNTYTPNTYTPMLMLKTTTTAGFEPTPPEEK